MPEVDNKIIICRSTRRYLKYILLWPTPKEELKPGKNYIMRIVTYILITFIIPFCLLMHLIVTTAKKLDVSVIEDISALTASVGIYYMTFIYVKNQPKLAHLLKDISNFEIFGKPTNFDQKDGTLNFQSTFAFIYCIVCVGLYNVLKLSRKKACEEKNVEKNLNENCGFMAQFWTPFSTENDVVYCIFYAYMFFCSQILWKPNIMLTFNAFEITEHVILKITHLNQMLLECFDDADYQVSRKRLTKCILYYTDIIKLATTLDKCFSNGMLTHISITAIICACIEKQFIEGDYVFAIIHLAGWILSLTFACFSGQILINASETIPSTLWFSKWYEVDIRLQRDFLFILARSQKSMHLTAGPFNTLYFPLLVSVVKMSYSMFCLITS